MRRLATRPLIALALCTSLAACALGTASRSAPTSTRGSVAAATETAPSGAKDREVYDDSAEAPLDAKTPPGADPAASPPAPMADKGDLAAPADAPAKPATRAPAEPSTTAFATGAGKKSASMPAGRLGDVAGAAMGRSTEGRALAGLAVEEKEAPTSEPSRRAPVVHERSGLQGGSRDDVGQRADYLKYLRTMGHVPAHRTDVASRVLVRAHDDLEQGLPNARVHVEHRGRRVASLTTYADGRTQFFPRALGLAAGDTVDLVLESQGGSRRRSVTLTEGDQDVGVIVPVLAQRKAPVVDVMFVLDTTGSMGDEIARIQLTLLDVAARIHRLEPSSTVRYGLTLYRDHGDAYVTQVRDFTTDVPAFLRMLEAVEADGGGDTPEALDEGLGAALTAQWTPVTVPNAVRVAILVADAPPHVDGGQRQGPDYVTHMRAAAERGIKVFPVGASGLDDQGEYVFRQLAHHTMARFVFITYGGGTSHHVGQFANNNLDDLVVGLVADEMADVLGRSRSSVRALAMAR